MEGRDHKDFRDLFAGNDRDERDPKADEERKESKPAYYYSYGPFRPAERRDNQDARLDRAGQPLEAEMARPRPVQTYNLGYEESKRKKPFTAIFASFIAGMLVISGLMFAADHYNLFTGGVSASGAGAAQQGTGGGAGQLTAGHSGGGGIQNAVLPAARPDTIAEMVEATRPAVVKIETFGTSSSGARSPFNDDFFRYFFGDSFQPPQQGERRQLGAGSGFIFDAEGYILTNEHVVAGADEIEVTVLGSKEPYQAELLGADFDLDLAVLKIEGDAPFPTLPLGDSSELRVGDWVTAIGNPLGFDHTVSVGVLSANEREIRIPDQQERRYREYEHLLQTDAAINQGNSGGPLLNLNGEVIGINTAVSAQAQGIGFAIPTSTVVSVLDKLKSNEPIPRPFIGVGLTDINESWVDELGLEDAKGAIITQVQANTTASRAGLQPYDVIIEMEGEPVENAQQFVDRIRRAEIGERITLTIVRDGQKYETAVTVGDRNDNK